MYDSFELQVVGASNTTLQDTSADLGLQAPSSEPNAPNQHWCLDLLVCKTCKSTPAFAILVQVSTVICTLWCSKHASQHWHLHFSHAKHANQKLYLHALGFNSNQRRHLHFRICACIRWCSKPLLSVKNILSWDESQSCHGMGASLVMG